MYSPIKREQSFERPRKAPVSEPTDEVTQDKIITKTSYDPMTKQYIAELECSLSADIPTLIEELKSSEQTREQHTHNKSFSGTKH